MVKGFIALLIIFLTFSTPSSVDTNVTKENTEVVDTTMLRKIERNHSNINFKTVIDSVNIREYNDSTIKTKVRKKVRNRTRRHDSSVVLTVVTLIFVSILLGLTLFK